MTKRTAEFVLGLIGGIFGFFGAIIALVVGGIASVFDSEMGSLVIWGGWFAVPVSIVGIIGASIVNTKTKVAGWLMIISAILGLNAIGFYYLLPCVLLSIAGLMALSKRGE